MTSNRATEARLAERLAALAERIARASRGADGPGDAVRLVAVTKTAGAAALLAALRLGLAHLGENRVQDAQARMELADGAGYRPSWQLIGHLQRNKAGRAAAGFSSVDSLDSVATAEALSRAAVALGRTVAVLVQVKPLADDAKSGLAPDDAMALAGAVATLPGLRLEGLMTILPLDLTDAGREGAFRSVGDCFRALRSALPDAPIHRLSMGMTDDFEAAIASGSTEVRIGRLLFEGL